MRASTDHERRAFVRAHTAPARVPFVPEIRLWSATEMTPLWQATNEWLDARAVDVPFWSTPWAGGQALARWVIDHPEAVRGLRVIDFGAGSGLVAIAAALAGAAHVTAIDVDPLACSACTLNAEANGVAIDVRCEDVVGRLDLDADVLFAGDVWYERAPAERFARWLADLAATTRVLTGDPGRTYAPKAFAEVARYEVPTWADLESYAVRTTRILRP